MPRSVSKALATVVVQASFDGPESNTTGSGKAKEHR
jgi:hypothetical protein